MNRHLAHALGATALGALLLQPVTAMADPPAHDRDDREHDRRYDDRRGWDSHYHPPRRGDVVHRVPHRHRVAHHHGHRHCFGGVPYYRAGPVYYVWNPRARGYVVTDRPYRRW